MKYLKKCLVLLPLVALAACTSVSQLDQSGLSTPGRNFGERGAHGNDCSIVSQVETGRLSGGGATGGSGSC